jgi:inhibitor of cysteine peptidase
MRLKIVTIVTAAVSVLGLFACTAQGSIQNASVEVSIDDFTNVYAIIKEVEVAEGGTLTVTLGSNRSTGFQWAEQADIADKSILEQMSHQNIAPQDSETDGAPGEEEWTFKALQSGMTTVSMKYSQPWEGGEEGLWKFILTVNVR